ncbi:protein kinase superfamily protein [Striga asiatica]|uniref:Protein kinase superfamily protein n=1 Tax=Striga asiatica TaxID=4170 RepID=A0A5A7PE05_STRAF|nr:protein kinase superfamily protein [Striga asiatica]
MAHSMVTADVSVPASSITCRKARHLQNHRSELHPRKSPGRRRGPVVELPQKEPDLVVPDGVERVEPRAGEDLDGGEAAEVPPVVSVGGAGEGDDHGKAAAEAEGEDGARFLGEAVVSAVDGGLQEVEVAKDWEGPGRAWREFVDLREIKRMRRRVREG